MSIANMIDLSSLHAHLHELKQDTLYILFLPQDMSNFEMNNISLQMSSFFNANKATKGSAILALRNYDLEEASEEALIARRKLLTQAIEYLRKQRKAKRSAGY